MKRKKFNSLKKKKIKFFSQLKTETIRRRRTEYNRAEEDFDKLLYKYHIENNFLSKSFKELKQYENINYETVYKKRQDLTSEFIITIDGEDAKDFDDAISLSYRDGFYHLKVHIADVSFFVSKDSSIDNEAKNRGCSIYLMNRVVPMLPFALSNDLCSLVQGKKRLTLTCDMKINKKGEVYQNSFYHSFIESRRRMTYDEVDSVLKGEIHLGKELDSFLSLCYELKNILYCKRINEGSINIETSELYFEMDSDERIKKIHEKKRLISESIIEEFMLVSNRCAAEFLKKHNTGIFRIHELPSFEKLSSFEQILESRKLFLPKGGFVNPLIRRGKSKYQILLEQIRDSHVKKIISYYLLTSLSKAVYSHKNSGHFGLSFKNYTHFTSPIRRYPDLIVHRLISKIIYSKMNVYKKRDLSSIAVQSSNRERIAMTVEREYEKLKSMRYLEDKIGEEFNCFITGKSQWGLFLRDQETMIEGFFSFPIHETVNTYIKKDIGDEVRAKLVSLDFRRMHIDFRLMD